MEPEKMFPFTGTTQTFHIKKIYKLAIHLAYTHTEHTHPKNGIIVDQFEREILFNFMSNKHINE